MTTIEFDALPAVEAPRRTPGLVVMKFGGTSVGDTDKLKRVAERLVAARAEGAKVVAVLSAMGKTTDELIRLAHEVSSNPHPREYDMLVSTGERISNALCAMAIHDLGYEALSFTGSQAGIVTDATHTKAKIVEVRAQRIHDALDANRIVLVAGFQGVTESLEITTLGRGGSDTTAVALAAAHPVLRIDGLTVLSGENKAAFYVPVTPFDPIVVYPAPSSYGSIAALSFQGVGIVGRPLSEGVHVIHLYEPLIIPAGAFAGLPDGLGLIYDNTWTITVAKPPHCDRDRDGDGGDRH